MTVRAFGGRVLREIAKDDAIDDEHRVVLAAIYLLGIEHSAGRVVAPSLPLPEFEVWLAENGWIDRGRAALAAL